MEYSIAQVEQLQRREQLAAIESEAQEAWRQVERSHLKTQFAREILRAAEAEHSERKGQYDALAASLEDAMRESKAVGGTSVLLVPGKVGGKDETHEHVWSRSIEQIRKCIPLCKKLKVHILIETVWNGFCLKPEQFRDYIDEIDSPWVQAYYDIGNMQKFAPSHEWIRILGKRTLKLDVKDWGRKTGFCTLGKGDVEWDKVRNELEKIDFKGWATREGGDGGDDKTAKLMNELLGL